MDGRAATGSLLLALVLVASAGAQEERFDLAEWSSEEVGVGVTSRTRHFPDLWGRPQYVCLLEADLRCKDVEIRFVCPGDLRITSRHGREHGAIAAINGGFCDPKGRNVGTFRIDGQSFGDAHEHRKVAIVLGPRRSVAISDDARGLWKGERTVLSSHPRLARNGRPVTSVGDGRHPRTAFGITASRKVLLVTVDGRSAESAGMTFEELARLMVALGADAALNMDGGGSTTAWVRGEPFAGVVSHPSDNRNFDHLGERRVGNAILVHSRDVVVADTEEAELSPGSAWSSAREGRGFLGKDYAVSPQAGASARWKLAVDFPGSWQLDLRWPRATGFSGKARVTWPGGESTVDQRLRGGKWHTIGRFEVESATTVEVVIEAAGDRLTVADAVRLEQL
jgi:hypothetical protein